ncbi:hypothetical protein F4782DRAFT_532624 [Xylaria castorea]|nr:hypothetical protein F4782DRAFT_532624 [Xylaria castorea]
MDLSPYEELASAVVLSRRLSYRLGLRNIRTLLNILQKYFDQGDENGTELGRLLEQSNSDIDELLNTLETDVMEFDNTTKGIYRRRIQHLWRETHLKIDSLLGSNVSAKKGTAFLTIPKRAIKVKLEGKRHEYIIPQVMCHAPAKTSSAYMIEAAEIPSRRVWRKLRSLDDISSPEAQAQPALSNERQITRQKLQYAIHYATYTVSNKVHACI